jgi:tetratricopeptide (TPR) repeat protein
MASADQDKRGQVVAAPYLVEGVVTSRRSGEDSWNQVRVGNSFRVGDTVKTGDDGAVAFKFVDGTLVRLGRLSAITFSDVRPKGAPVVMQGQGRAFYFSRGARNEPEIRTPTVNAAIYGTELVVSVSDGGEKTTVDLLHGSVRASNENGSLELAMGERVTAIKGAPLEKAILVRPADSVQWMIRLPLIITLDEIYRGEDRSCDASCVSRLSALVAAINRGEQTLLGSLSGSLGAELKGGQYYEVLSVVALWRAGDVSGAVSRLKSITHRLSPALDSLKDVILGYQALFNNDLSSADSFANSAEEKSTKASVNVKLLRSYIAQSRGELDLALEALAPERDPALETPQLVDRRAELLLSTDNPASALDVLSRRNNTYGGSALGSALTGFAALERKEYELAALSFKDSISRDSSLALGYLGLALLSVKDREYAAAKDLISQAVQLEPSNAVYRAYLGKLFFEDQDTSRALEEFSAAIALDPNDPSPYLYRSYSRVANNDPIRGLEDVERSIELNDGRAVYRSSLALDRDVAVRSAGLGRVFNELGFSEAARIEAIKSLTEDYGNFSAHRLLADSYASIIDGEANLSERRIADLMAPLSFNLFNSIGETPSFGDYNAMFDKKETRHGARLEWSSNRDQIGGELISSGKGDEWGYLTSYQPFYMSGSRARRFSGANTFRSAIQYEPSVDNRFIVDGSFSMIEASGTGSLENYSEDVRVGDLRIGYNRKLSSTLRLLTQAEIGRDREISSVNTERDIDLFVPEGSEGIPVLTQLDQSTRDRIQRSSISSQLIYTSKYLDSVSGIEALYADTSRREYSTPERFSEYPDEVVSGSIRSSSAGSLNSGQVYEYVSLKAPRIANLTLGMAATTVENELSEVPPFKMGDNLETALAPKVGLVVTPTKWLTTRAAYFEGLSRKSVLEDLTSLEPTLVGGINQRYNDLSGAYSRNYGFGVDLKDANRVYVGTQYVHRNTRETIGEVTQSATYDGSQVASLEASSEGFFDLHSESDIVRSYLYSVLSAQSALSLEALNHWYNDTEVESGRDISTERYRVGYRYFLGKHFSLSTQATYRNQRLEYFDDPRGFWLFDTGVSYRFSEQRGKVFARIDNLLDRDFDYDQSSGVEYPLLQGRSFVVGVSYNFW